MAEGHEGKTECGDPNCSCHEWKHEKVELKLEPRTMEQQKELWDKYMQQQPPDLLVPPIDENRKKWEGQAQYHLMQCRNHQQIGDNHRALVSGLMGIGYAILARQ